MKNKYKFILESDKIKLDSLLSKVLLTNCQDKTLNDQYHSYFVSLMEKYQIPKGYSINISTGKIVKM